MLVEGGTDGQYLPSGHLIYVRLGVVYAIPFDPTRLELKGGPVSVLQGVEQGGLAGGHAADLAVPRVGSVLYSRGGASETRTLAWVLRAWTACV